MRLLRGTLGALMLLLCLPPGILLIWTGASRFRSEPWADIILMDVLLTVVMTAAAVPTILLFWWKGIIRPLRLDLVWYVLVGAFGSTALMIVLDAGDDYFTDPGVGWIWPLTGAVLGGIYGGAFRLIGGAFVRRRPAFPASDE